MGKRLYNLNQNIFNEIDTQKSILIYDYLYKDSTIYLERKKLKFEEIIQEQLKNIQDVQRL